MIGVRSSFGFDQVDPAVVVLDDRARLVRDRCADRLDGRLPAHPGRGPLRGLQLGDPALGRIARLPHLPLHRRQARSAWRSSASRAGTSRATAKRSARATTAERRQLDGLQRGQTVGAEQHFGHDGGGQSSPRQSPSPSGPRADSRERRAARARTRRSPRFPAGPGWRRRRARSRRRRAGRRSGSLQSRPGASHRTDVTNRRAEPQSPRPPRRPGPAPADASAMGASSHPGALGDPGAEVPTRRTGGTSDRARCRSCPALITRHVGSPRRQRRIPALAAH